MLRKSLHALCIVAGTLIPLACSPEPGETSEGEGPAQAEGSPGTGAPSGEPKGSKRPAGGAASLGETELRCRLEFPVRGRPEGVLWFGEGQLAVATRGAETHEGAVGTIHLWDSLDETARVIELPDYLIGPVVHGEHLVVASRASSEVLIVDAEAGQVIDRRDTPDPPRALDSDGTRLAVVTRQGTLEVFDGDTWTRYETGLALVTTMLVEEDRIWLGSQATGELVEWSDGEVRSRFPLGGIPRDLLRHDVDGNGSAELCVAVGEHHLVLIDGDKRRAETVGSIPIALAPTDEGLAILAHGDLAYRVVHGDEVLRRRYVGQDVWDMASGDGNGDGHLDLAISNRGAARVSILYGEAGGSFRESTDLAVGRGPQFLTAIDLNGDGGSEVASVDALEDVLTVHDLAAGTKSSTPLTGVVVGLVGTDVDLDGENDLVLGFNDGRVTAWPSGDATREKLLGPFGEQAAGLCALPGDAGVAVCDPTGAVTWAPWNGEARRVELAGLPIAVAPVGDRVVVALGGSGNFRGVQTLDANGQLLAGGTLDLSDIPPVDLCACDVDGDGVMEVALLVRPHGENGPGALAILRAEGDGWRPITSHPTGLRAFGVAAGDLDGDGATEVIVGAQNSHHVNLWWSRGGKLVRSPDLGVGRGVLDVEIADVDGSGASVIAANNFSFDVSVIRTIDR